MWSPMHWTSIPTVAVRSIVLFANYGSVFVVVVSLLVVPCISISPSMCTLYIGVYEHSRIHIVSEKKANRTKQNWWSSSYSFIFAQQSMVRIYGPNTSTSETHIHTCEVYSNTCYRETNSSLCIVDVLSKESICNMVKRGRRQYHLNKNLPTHTDIQITLIQLWNYACG